MKKKIYDLKNFEEYILDNCEQYINQYQEDEVKINWGYHILGDPKEENNIERIIRKVKCEIDLNIDPKKVDSNKKVEKIIKSTINESYSIKKYYHLGYIEYLLCAWENDLGIEIGPWNIWNIILWNIKLITCADPNKFKSLWMIDESIKSTILRKNNIEEFEIKDLYNIISENIPNNTKEALIYDFKNSPNNYTECMYGMIADIYKEYVKTYLLCCKITDVKIVGDREEWEKLILHIGKVKDIYKEYDEIKLNNYFERINNYVIECLVNLDNKDFWLKFFYVENCGSGSQQEIKGGIKNLLFDENEILIEKIPKIISKFPFECIDTTKSKHNFTSGVLTSYLNEYNILVPEYQYFITEYDKNILQNEKEEKDKNNLLKCLEILNSYSISPIFHNPISDKVFLEEFNNVNFYLGKISEDEFIDYIKNKHGNSINELKARQFIREKQQKFKNKEILDVLYDILDNNENLLNKKRNFWMGEKENYCSKGHLYLRTEDWIRGRRRQKKEDINLICEYMDDIVEILDEEYKGLVPRINKHDYIFYVILSSYNEDIYKSFINSYSKKYKKESEIISFTYIWNLNILINFLIDKSVHNLRYDYIKYYKNHDSQGICHDIIHSRNIAIHLIIKITENLSENEKKLLLRLNDPNQIKVLDEVINSKLKLNNKKYISETKTKKNNLFDILDILTKREKYIEFENNLFIKNFDKIHLIYNIIGMEKTDYSLLIKVMNDNLSNNNLTIRINNDNKLCLVEDEDYIDESKTDDFYNNNYKIISDIIKTFLDYISEFTVKFEYNLNNKLRNRLITNSSVNINEFNYWSKEKLIWDDNSINNRDVIINMDQWAKGMNYQNDRMDIFEKNFSEIYNFLKMNDINGIVWTEFIFHTFNPILYRLFIEEYKKNPYNLDKDDIFKENPKIDNINKIELCIINILIKLFYNNRIDANVKQILIVNIIEDNEENINEIYDILLLELKNVIRLIDKKQYDYFYNDNKKNLSYLEGKFKILIEFIKYLNFSKKIENKFDNKMLSKIVFEVTGEKIDYDNLENDNNQNDNNMYVFN